MTISLKELKRIIRKIEFNKTEHQLLIQLIEEATKVGEEERERVENMYKTSLKIFKELSIKNMFFYEALRKEQLKKVPVGSVDGSFQVTGGIGGRWYAVIGVAQVIAPNGFTLAPKIKVGGMVKTIKANEEREAKSIATKIMMMAENKAILDIVRELRAKKAYLMIDGPIIDPPALLDKEYIDYRVDVLEECLDNDIIPIGFVKRVASKNFINILKGMIPQGLFIDYTTDLELLFSILNMAMREQEAKYVYLKPVYYGKGVYGEYSMLSRVYKEYENRGLRLYYTYFKPNLRSRVYRIEVASFKNLDEKALIQLYKEIIGLMNLWILPGLNIPLPIILAHSKCNIRKGAAETLYYEIISRMVSQEKEFFIFTEEL